MNININNSPILNKNVELSKLLVGQRLTVEVISTDRNQQGLVSLGGKIHPAKIEAEVKPGDRFLAAVRETNGQEIILSRENINGRITGLSNEQFILLLNRGLGIDSKILLLLNQFTQSTDTALMSILMTKSPDLNNLARNIWKSIPQWAEINGQTFNYLVKYYYLLGLEHERDIYELYKNDARQKETNEPSVKEQILLLLKEHAGKLPIQQKEYLELLLDKITAQQMWIQTGARENAYFLMHIPLQSNGTIYNCRIAVESSRKGNKIDVDHCHIAIEVETENLGIIGADLRLFEQRLQICLLNNDTDLHPLLETIYESTKERFTNLGLILDNITIKTFEENPQFANFIAGQFVSGVDFEG
ncbi:MAG: hypothetical protein APF84_17575 [Gracilibacter sp. BRH_c7a]|nr:MAG: hypothetical protein APF84_17575 [Gracilibacter sp. BRH_c7a]